AKSRDTGRLGESWAPEFRNATLPRHPIIAARPSRTPRHGAPVRAPPPPTRPTAPRPPRRPSRWKIAGMFADLVPPVGASATPVGGTQPSRTGPTAAAGVLGPRPLSSRARARTARTREHRSGAAAAPARGSPPAALLNSRATKNATVPASRARAAGRCWASVPAPESLRRCRELPPLRDHLPTPVLDHEHARLAVHVQIPRSIPSGCPPALWAPSRLTPWSTANRIAAEGSPSSSLRLSAVVRSARTRRGALVDFRHRPP